MIAPLLDHLWQSSLCVGAAGLIALALRQNGANVRFWVWFAASIKFLVPFAALTALSAYALAPMLPPVAGPTAAFVTPLAKPFSAPAMVPVPTRLTDPAANLPPPAQAALSAPAARPAPSRTRPMFHLDLESALLALWAAGILMLAARWLVGWVRIRALLRDAVDMRVEAPVEVKFSTSQLEPGLVGILNPVILLPQGIERQLSPAELKAVLVHELSHWRRHDNLLAAVHMLVEALFWFFPLVWWLGARLNIERERACDESVLTEGNDPQIYAEGILKVCRAYLQSPLVCVAGISGGSLKRRIETIMENKLILRLSAAHKLVLSVSAAAALALPLALGLMAVPVAQTQAKAAPLPSPAPNLQTTRRAPIPASENAAATDVAPLVRHTSHLLAKANLIVPSPDVPRLLPHTQTLVALNDPPAVAAPNSSQENAMLKQTLVAFTALLGLNQAAAAQTCTLPSLVDTVKLQQVPGTNLMTVPVAINGTPKQFLLDIGTGPTEIGQAAVTQLGLPQNTKLTEGIGARGSDMASHSSDLGALTNGGLSGVSVYDVRDKTGAAGAQTHIRIPSFTIGGATAQHLTFLLANDADMGTTSEPYDGLLTGDFFKQYDVELDFGGKQVNWLTPTKCTDPNQVVFWAHSEVAMIPMTIMDGKISVPVSVQGHQINAVIDTSSSRTVMRRDVAELIVGLKAGADMTLDGDLKDGKGQPVYDHTFSQISFAGGGVTANNVPALILTNSLTHEINSGPVLGSWARSSDARIPDLTLGMDVLKQLHLYVVPGQRTVYVTSAGVSG